jgi:hypothetical protein
MDRNTDLLLAKAGESIRWEDQEKPSNDTDRLREEFRCRLYARVGDAPRDEQNGKAASGEN